VAVEQRLDHLAHEQFAGAEEDEHEQGERPAGDHGEGQSEWGGDGDDGADEGHEAHHGGEDPPQDGVGQARDGQAAGDEGAEAGVDGHLEQEVARKPVRCVVQGQDGSVQVRPADEADQAVAQVFAEQQHEDDEDEDQARGADGTQQRGHDGFHDDEGGAAGGRGLGDGNGLARGGGGGHLDVVGCGAEHAFEGGLHFVGQGAADA